MNDMRKILSQVRCFLLDMDGTFYLGEQLIDGSLDFLNALKKTGRQCLFLTNNSSKSGQAYRQKLARMGVPEEFRHVLTSGQAAARYVTNAYPGKKAFLMANQMVTEELTGLGVEVDQARPDYVLLTYDTEMTYEKMAALCDYVRAGLPYIATHPDVNCPTEGGCIPDCGSFLAFVKASTGRDPDVIIGKPNRGIVEGTLRLTGLPKESLAMVGDRLYTDIATGVNFGMTSILVLSGETTREMADASPIRPTLTVPRLAALIPDL